MSINASLRLPLAGAVVVGVVATGGWLVSRASSSALASSALASSSSSAGSALPGALPKPLATEQLPSPWGNTTALGPLERGEGIVRFDDGSIQVPKDVADALLASAWRLGRDLDVVAVDVDVDGAGVGGFQIVSIRAGSPFYKLDFEPGDVVVRVAGVALVPVARGLADGDPDGSTADVAGRADVVLGDDDDGTREDGGLEDGGLDLYNRVRRSDALTVDVVRGLPAERREVTLRFVVVDDQGRPLRSLRGDDIVMTSEGSFDVPRPTVRAALEDLSRLSSQGQLVPTLRDGSVAGLRVLHLERGALLDRLGLQSGDVVKRLNGRDIGDLSDEGVAALKRLPNEDVVVVDLQRRGELVTLDYSIH